MNRLQKGQSLVGVIVAFFVLVVVAVYYFNGGFGNKDDENKRADGKGETLIGKSRYAAEDSVCRANLKNIRMAVSIATDPVDDLRPQSLSELPGNVINCSIDDEPYDYDPATGTVTCPHLGHEDY